ncbi:hypothetical protein H310_01038 [Aphanomyces invadans]|uniref:Uncharacterized protein n=1 Tax=Aphanomyces invadans TaxID=157072 RepID=A0A024US72_9STRA|nr:hypothetical protein H310_01038 [Aphanomyces invadans]ETW08458.1 hypothetical protein H310_01038 [Aphanomyces invadans]|eukprot:XP_008862263.1 hypothetical protein H310_01038 [Aphanomyces invadans]
MNQANLEDAIIHSVKNLACSDAKPWDRFQQDTDRPGHLDWKRPQRGERGVASCVPQEEQAELSLLKQFDRGHRTSQVRRACIQNIQVMRCPVMEVANASMDEKNAPRRKLHRDTVRDMSQWASTQVTGNPHSCFAERSRCPTESLNTIALNATGTTWRNTNRWICTSESLARSESHVPEQM